MRKAIVLFILLSLCFTSGTQRREHELKEEESIEIADAEPECKKADEVIEEVVEKRSAKPMQIPQGVLDCKPFEEPIENPVPNSLTEQDRKNILALARTAAGEYFLIDTPKHKMYCAAVMWCACWRSLRGAAGGFNSTVEGVCSQPYQFLGYMPNAAVSEELLLFAEDVYTRFLQAKDGKDLIEIGCVLPQDYLWFVGNGKINIFRNKYIGGNIWDWTLPNPYEKEN